MSFNTYPELEIIQDKVDAKIHCRNCKFDELFETASREYNA